MVRVAGLWELGWNTPIKEVDLWEYPLRDFEVEAFYMAPISGIRHAMVQERNSIEEIIKECGDYSLVFVDERGKIPLKEFEHPKKALYIFGKASESTMPMAKHGDHTLRIETRINRGMLWPHQAAALVLYDRLMKT